METAQAQAQAFDVPPYKRRPSGVGDAPDIPCIPHPGAAHDEGPDAGTYSPEAVPVAYSPLFGSQREQEVEDEEEEVDVDGGSWPEFGPDIGAVTSPQWTGSSGSLPHEVIPVRATSLRAKAEEVTAAMVAEAHHCGVWRRKRPVSAKVSKHKYTDEGLGADEGVSICEDLDAESSVLQDFSVNSDYQQIRPPSAGSAKARQRAAEQQVQRSDHRRSTSPEARFTRTTSPTAKDWLEGSTGETPRRRPLSAKAMKHKRVPECHEGPTIYEDREPSVCDGDVSQFLAVTDVETVEPEVAATRVTSPTTSTAPSIPLSKPPLRPRPRRLGPRMGGSVSQQQQPQEVGEG